LKERSDFLSKKPKSHLKRLSKLAGGTALLIALGTTSVLAAVPVPISRPTPPPPSILLSDADGHAFWDGLDARQKGNWVEVRRHARQITDPVAKALLNWLQFQKQGAGATLAEIVAFQEAYPTWPRQHLLSTRAEEALTDYPMNDRDVVAWFATRDPLTGEGKIRLGEALINIGQTSEGASWIQRAWVEHQFSRSREAEILRKHARHLPAQAHEDRLNRLIWEQRFADGRRMLQLVNAEARTLADARLKLSSRARGAESALARVPPHLRLDTGLVFDHARYLRRRGQNETAIPLFLTAPAAPHDVGNPERWWTERKILARKALAEGQFQEAYHLATGHGHDRGVAFAEGEFLAGWIALQYLNDADTAFRHFQTLESGVATPISRSRGAYWMGRAAEAAGRSAEATTHYTKAAGHRTTFYGQLAMARLTTNGTALLQLANDPVPTASQGSALSANNMVRAFELLNEAGEKGLARSFVVQLAKTLPDAASLAALADLMVERGMPNLSVRVAKVAAGRSILLPERSYPTAVLPSYRQVGAPVERALVYGLSRQESEFDPGAISHAGARGLMQLMPRTAREVARQISVPYQRARLTNDPGYNAMLGSAHLSDLLDDFAGSYIMTIAAYNAGAHRVSQWVETYGDPRSPAIDPIDWMENIPFTETRNYVQRVMENIQVYRARLANQSADLRIEQDITRYDGTAPLIYVTPKPQATMAPIAPLSPPAGQAVPTTSLAALPPAASPVRPAATTTTADLPLPNPNRPAPVAPAQTPASIIAPAPSIQPVPRALSPIAPTSDLPSLDAPVDGTTMIQPAHAPLEGAMQPVIDEDDMAARAARIGTTSPQAEAVAAPTPLLAPQINAPAVSLQAPQSQTTPLAPLAIERNTSPIRLTPPPGLDHPRAPNGFSQSEVQPQEALTPGTMQPIADEASGS
jgi:peptidoglycan lytic transglycosylase